MQKKINKILDVTVPLVGPRGGKIKISMNKVYTGFGPKPWQIKKRIQTHFAKYIKYASQEHKPNHNEIRAVVFIRYLGLRNRIMDEDNFRGGCKSIMDLLTYRGWIWDDDPGHIRPKYTQDSTSREKGERLRILVGSFKDNC